ncbi:MerR family transcriptional regulator [Kribbella sp. NPDC050124]|uniref:MerR family transcriptional regulator n=1 Tax=Kribbella sp. NPDC050124 TaxID=3364114 RepID=UPI0037A33B7C
MLTIGQLARYVGVSTKTVRVYHAKGLLPEPERDASGYRRYGAQAIVDLVRIRTLAEAGVPLARIRDLDQVDLGEALQQIDADLTARIRDLRDTQRRLRKLAAGDLKLLPAEVETHLQHLEKRGFTTRWVELERELWIVVFATHPEIAGDLFRDQADALTDPALEELYLTYDQAHDLDPADPSLSELADRIVEATVQRYDPSNLPGQATGTAVPQLLQSTINASSPAWQRLDGLIRHRLKQMTP